MADGIEAGAFLEYELGIQVMPDDGTGSFFAGIDLLGPAKLVPEELAPVQLIGKLALNRNPAAGLHRAWGRVPDVMASAVPPVLTS
jgi:catalase